MNKKVCETLLWSKLNVYLLLFFNHIFLSKEKNLLIQTTTDPYYLGTWHNPFNFSWSNTDHTRSVRDEIIPCIWKHCKLKHTKIAYSFMLQDYTTEIPFFTSTQKLLNTQLLIHLYEILSWSSQGKLLYCIYLYSNNVFIFPYLECKNFECRICVLLIDSRHWNEIQMNSKNWWKNVRSDTFMSVTR